MIRADMESPNSRSNAADDADVTEDVIHAQDDGGNARSNADGSLARRRDEVGEGDHTHRHDASDAHPRSPSINSPVLRKRNVSVGCDTMPPPGNHHVRDSTSSAAAIAATTISNLTGDTNHISNLFNDNNAANNNLTRSSNQNQRINRRRHEKSTSLAERRTTDISHQNENNNREQQQNIGPTDEERAPQEIIMMQQFWRTYDTIIILSIFAVLGIMFRMMSATWFRMELGVVFSEDSALGTNLPLNIWSCFLMGLLCSGREAMGIVHSKVLGGANLYGSGRGILDVGKGAYRGVVDAGKAGINLARGHNNTKDNSRNRSSVDTNLASASENLPPCSDATSPPTNGSRHTVSSSTLAQSVEGDGQLSPRGDSSAVDEDSIAGLLGLDDEFRIAGSQQNTEDEIREVQLRGLTGRIMRSPCLVIFPARKESNDVMEHYETNPVSPTRSKVPTISEHQFEIGDWDDNSNGDVESGGIEMSEQLTSSSGEASGETSGQHEGARTPPTIPEHTTGSQQLTPSSECDNHPICRQRTESSSAIEEKVDEIIHSVSDHVTTLRRVHILDGWNVDTSPEKMKHIILLGLRVGFCGALSTFSSLNASVIRLLRAGAVGEALIGYAISIQMGIVSYRFGQHVAVYVFVWRCRRETKRDEKRGYGLRLRSLDSDEETIQQGRVRAARRFIPSVRTVATLSFLSMLVSLCLAVYFSTEHKQYWCSLLFTPFGCLARFALMSKYNKNLPGFPLGTFSCNLLSCALSGSLGSFLAGNPGPEESVLLISMIAGFAGSLSTFATFIVEILSLMDPIIFKFDGLVYALITILWAVIIGALGSQAKNWADEV